MSSLCADHGPCRTGDVDEVRRLLESKIDPNESCEPHGSTAVHQAATGGSGEVLRLLYDFGADLTARDGRMLTAAHLAADAGHVEAAAGHVAVLEFFQEMNAVLRFLPPSCSTKLLHLTESILRGEQPRRPILAEAARRTWLDLEEEE
eukprot:g27538.t1